MINYKKIILCVFVPLWLLICNAINAQQIYEPINNDIYQFLDRMNIKGIIQLDSEVKPFTRKYIAEKLSIVFNKENQLNKVDKAELNWHKHEYASELNTLLTADWQLQTENGFFRFSPRLRLFNYDDSLFSLKLSPIAAYGISAAGKKTGYSRRIGLRAYGYYSSWFGASLHMTDNGEFGDNVDRDKLFTPKRGADEISVEDGIEFSDVRAQLNFSWGWGSVSLKKDYMEWGNAYFGNVILSDKAPSFPHIYLELKPVDWFRFYYTYGWIHSGVVDSSTRYLNNAGGLREFYFEEFYPKYYVANLFTFMPWSWLDVSIGNFMVYAGDVRPEMFIPFGFFKYFDRDVGKKSTQDGNGGLHFDLAVRFPNTFKFYSSLFVDVTSIRGLLKSDLHETWVAYTFGGRKVDLFIDNLDLTVEYTHLNPWIYEHKYELTTYKHLNYPIGHWIGQNGDQIRLQFDYQFLRGLKLKLWYERVRKGGMKDISIAYDSSEPVQKFLYGPLRKDNIIGFNAKYEIFHELFVELNYYYSDISDTDEARTPEYLLGRKNNFSFSVYYGLP